MSWNDIFESLKEQGSQLRILYLVKLFINEGQIKSQLIQWSKQKITAAKKNCHQRPAILKMSRNIFQAERKMILDGNSHLKKK
jgi:hypothetical protein